MGLSHGDGGAPQPSSSAADSASGSAAAANAASARTTWVASAGRIRAAILATSALRRPVTRSTSRRPAAARWSSVCRRSVELPTRRTSFLRTSRSTRRVAVVGWTSSAAARSETVVR